MCQTLCLDDITCGQPLAQPRHVITMVRYKLR
jgi:hypothetical protein